MIEKWKNDPDQSKHLTKCSLSEGLPLQKICVAGELRELCMARIPLRLGIEQALLMPFALTRETRMFREAAQCRQNK